MARRPTIQPSAFWKRLEEALGNQPGWQPFNPNRVATKLGMSQGSVHRWYVGTGLPEIDTARELARAGGVCLDWLVSNVKPKYPISQDPVLKELLEIVEGLNEDGRKAVLRTAEGEALREQVETSRKRA